MWSKRLPWASNPNPLSRLLAEKRSRGEEVLDLTESNPTRAGILYPREGILSSLAQESNLLYEAAPLGLPRAREAVARHYQKRGLAVRPDHVVLTASTSEAYSFLFKLLCDPGDRVMGPRPSYPVLEYLTALEGIGLDAYALRHDGEWTIDFDTIREAAGPRTRALVAVNPNNPTGSYVKPHERAALLDFCRERGLAIIADEVFSDYPLDETRASTFLEEGGEILTFVLSGLSKTAGLPQMKLGWIIVGAPETERAQALEGLDQIGDTFLSVGAPVQNAAEALLDAAHEVQSAIRRRLRENVTALKRLEKSPASPLRVEGGWYAVIRLPRVLGSEAWALELLSRDDVHVHPGYLFDFAEEAYVVVSLLTPGTTFAAGIDRLAKRVESVTAGPPHPGPLPRTGGEGGMEHA